MRFFLITVTLSLFIFTSKVYSNQKGYIQIAGLIDLRTRFSDGALDLESLISLAKRKGFSLIFINDHDRMVMEYGLFPLRNVIRKRVERNSINRGGAENFIKEIKNARRRHPDMIIVPGSESAPFYYWSGSPLKGDLTANNHERRILVIGLEEPSYYSYLPILHNGIYLRYMGRELLGLLPCIFSLFIGIFLTLRGISIKWGLLISVISALFIWNGIGSLEPSPYDPYHGDLGPAPYQLLIDYVRERGGLTFWNYPETRSGVRRMGPISVRTEPYPEMLRDTYGYTGFAALYGDRITITRPGGLWDQLLLKYIRGERDSPIWGIATADFHSEGEAGEVLGNYPTVFLVRERSRKAVLDAMKRGRMYACSCNYPQMLILEQFTISDPKNRKIAICGDEIALKGRAIVEIALRAMIPSDKEVRVRLIRSGRPIKEWKVRLPFKVRFEDEEFKATEKGFYRLEVLGIGKLLSNPIFFNNESFA